MPSICISLDKAKSGMRLAEDVCINDGKMVLCKRGAILTDKMIQRFENMGVNKIIIEKSLTEEELKLLLEEKILLIEKAFNGKESPCMIMLKNVFLKFWKNKWE